MLFLQENTTILSILLNNRKQLKTKAIERVISRHDIIIWILAHAMSERHSIKNLIETQREMKNETKFQFYDKRC